MRRMPQPIPYQGSKRNIAGQILSAFPAGVGTLVEPFAGSAAVSVAAAYYQKAENFYLNDLNQPLMDLLAMIINEPQEIADGYERLWQAQLGRERSYYDFVRDEFNRTHRPDYLLYLLARCVKASVRYNANGDFNQSPDNRRKGRRPSSMRQEILGVSRLLQGKTVVASGDYREVLSVISSDDLVYMDPPYQGTSQNKDPRYYSGLHPGELVDFLEELNRRQIMFILSYDGRTGTKTYGAALPSSLNLRRIEIHAGRSSQSTLLGKSVQTYESLYLSPALMRRLGVEGNGRMVERVSGSGLSDDMRPRQLELDIV
ncbi:MAG: DNA adenine methylase [Chloroflexi bacterium]|nr:DNA adenine methylase [Chloroflexota bacterium]